MIVPNLFLNFETQYYEILNHLMRNGVKTKNRTGVDTLTDQHGFVFLQNVGIDFPIIKCKSMSAKLALIELMWFFNGKTDIEWLNSRGLNYWNDWKLEDGTIGKSYGYQYRNFNGIDNLQHCIDLLSQNPTSRQNILNIWNVSDLKEMSLPPCVFSYHFCCVGHPVENHYYIDLHVQQRSCDMFLGVPYDFMLVGWMINIVAMLATVNPLNILNTIFVARHIYYTMNDIHIYCNHIEAVEAYMFEYGKSGWFNQETQFEIEYPNKPTTLNEYLSLIDLNQYSNFNICKTNWVNRNPRTIKAPVAI